MVIIYHKKTRIVLSWFNSWCSSILTLLADKILTISFGTLKNKLDCGTEAWLVIAVLVSNQYPLHQGMLGATDSKGKTHMDKDTTYMKDKLSFSSALLQDGIDHIVFLLFWNASWRRGWDVERHAWRNQSEDEVLSFVYTYARPHGVGLCR